MGANTPELTFVSPSKEARLTWGDVTVDRVRCVLRHRDRFLLADHGSSRRHKPPKWGLPGGRLLPNEEPAACLRRELDEELRLRVSTVVELGDWWHREENYRVFGAELRRAARWFDGRELKAIAWLSFAEVERIAGEGLLHKGFELEAIAELRRRFPA